ncbi:hypothetical protein BHE74_00005948 [Ensete ventricosum]|nr:hypothetical protein BHE74_00005948 [Ensete ventricosum]
MLHWVGATIIRFQRREAEVLWDGRILNFLNEGRAAKGSLTTLIFHPDDHVDAPNRIAREGMVKLRQRSRQILGGLRCRRLTFRQQLGKALKSLGSYRQDPEIKWGGVSPGSLNRRQYRPGVREGGFPSPNKTSGGGGCGATPEACCITEGTSSPRLSGAECSCDIVPYKKMLLDDLSDSRGRHNMDQPTRARPAQRGVKPGEDMKRLLGSGHRGGGESSSLFRGWTPTRKDLRRGGGFLPTRSLRWLS